jgi:hypothetical protein
MASSLELDSSFAQSTSVDSTTTTQSKGKKWRAPYWKYYRRLTQDDLKQDILYCTQCSTDLYSTLVSKNMIDHLVRHHQIVIERSISKAQVAMNKQLK